MYQPPCLNRSGMHVIGTRLTKQFGPIAAVNELDLDVAAGQVYGFLGPNGAGKTTTIRMLLSLIAPTGGQARLLGWTLPDPRAVAQTGSMLEEPAFYPWLTGRQNLQVLAATGGGCAAAEFGRAFCLTGLSEVAGRKVRTYPQACASASAWLPRYKPVGRCLPGRCRRTLATRARPARQP